jgi:T5SS/PEP-CTERM-associated repeat protein
MRLSSGFWRSVLAITATCSLVCHSPSLANNDIWSTAADGVWTVGSNWLDGSVPGNGDMATFNAAGTYTVTFNNQNPNPPAIQALLLENNADVTFAGNTFLSQRTLSVNSGGDRDVVITENASLTLGTFGGGLVGDKPVHLTVGDQLRLIHGGLLRVRFGSNVNVASLIRLAEGSGSMQISEGGTVQSAAGFIGSFTGSSATVLVTGANSQWVSSGEMTVGGPGGGTLSISSEGLVQNTNGFIGVGGGFDNLAIVDGMNSRWMNTGDLDVGFSSKGTLKVTAGGRVDAANARVGSGDGATGKATIDGGGSQLNSTGIVLVAGFGTGVGTLTVSNGGTVNAGGGVLVRLLGTLKGDGQIIGGLGNIGTVAPGTSPGALHVTGNYTQGATGKLQIELAGTAPGSGYDQLLVTGSANLAGTLDVSLAGSFTPSIGNVFEVVHANGGVLGGFPTLNLPAIPNGMGWAIVYTGLGVFLNVESAPLIGDYNHNNVVDAADYALWRDSLGQTGAGLAADGNHNNQIDPGDYDVWRARFGQVTPSGATLPAEPPSAVPEAEAMALMVAGILAMCFRPRTLK